MMRTAKIIDYGLRLLRREYGLKWFCAVCLQTLAISRWLIIDRGAYRIRFSTKSNLAAAVWVNPSARIEEERFLSRYLKPGYVVIDVGANIGLVSLTAAAMVGPSGHVFAFEPHPQTFKYLKENIALNQFDQVECFNLAVAKAHGSVNFTNYRSDDTNKVAADGQIRVEATRLDDMMAYYDLIHIDLLKIDVEGFERDVLLGASEILGKTTCIFIEVLEHRLKDYGSSQEEIVGILHNVGFHLWRMAGDKHNLVGSKKLLSRQEQLDLELSPINIDG